MPKRRLTAPAPCRYDPDAAQLERDKSRTIYVIGPADGPVKIGFADDVSARLSSMQSGSPVELILHAKTPGGREAERLLHRRFASSRIRGEWFALTPEVASFVAALKSGDGLPERLPEVVTSWNDLLKAIGRTNFRREFGFSDATFSYWIAKGSVPEKRQSVLLDYARTVNIDTSALIA